jgi:hypothetical protein
MNVVEELLVERIDLHADKTDEEIDNDQKMTDCYVRFTSYRLAEALTAASRYQLSNRNLLFRVSSGMSKRDTIGWRNR